MNQNQKKKLQLTRGLSIALALLVVAAITITVVAVVSGRRNKPNPSQTGESTTAGTSGTTATQQPPETTNPNTPVGADRVSFVSPVTNGNIGKAWSGDIPVFSDTMEDYRVHLGVDIEADAGTPVYAAADGTVESVEFDPMMGQTIVISHANGYKSVYRNLTTKVTNGITAGVTVKAGDQIGEVGDTALVEISQSPHLHFEIYQDNVCIDPLTQVTVAPIDDATHYED